MKKVIGVLTLAAIAIVMMTSSSVSKGKKGIEFSHITLEKAKMESAKSGKLIFIDAYTDWCGPCKKMAATSFKDPDVAAVFNEAFVNLKVEMEKNPDGQNIARQYRVRAYPTLLFIDSEGKLVKQSIGFKTKDELMALAESVL